VTVQDPATREYDPRFLCFEFIWTVSPGATLTRTALIVILMGTRATVIHHHRHEHRHRHRHCHCYHHHHHHHHRHHHPFAVQVVLRAAQLEMIQKFRATLDRGESIVRQLIMGSGKTVSGTYRQSAGVIFS
jgi:G3E family GTPase